MAVRRQGQFVVCRQGKPWGLSMRELEGVFPGMAVGGLGRGWGAFGIALAQGFVEDY